MKAISFDAPETIRVFDAPLPDAPGKGEVRVAVHRVGICGTDMSCYLGKFPFFAFPRTPGHELGVEVLECGPGVTNVQPGDHCSVEPYLNNPDSYSSRIGRPNCCNDLRVIGVHMDGGMCEQINLPSHKLHKSVSLGFDQLALVETLAIGYHAVERAGVQADENVLIIGSGPIGLSALEFARVRGGRPLVLDVNADRLAFCREKMRVSGTVMVEIDGSELERIKEMTSGNLCEVVIDATGNNRSMSRALEFVAYAGRLVYVGITSGTISFPHPLMHRKEMTILSSRNSHPADFGEIIKLMEDGTVNTDPWITHRTTMDQLSNDFPTFLDPKNGVLKAMIEIT